MWQIASKKNWIFYVLLVCKLHGKCLQEKNIALYIMKSTSQYTARSKARHTHWVLCFVHCPRIWIGLTLAEKSKMAENIFGIFSCFSLVFVFLMHAYTNVYALNLDEFEWTTQRRSFSRKLKCQVVKWEIEVVIRRLKVDECVTLHAVLLVVSGFENFQVDM